MREKSVWIVKRSLNWRTGYQEGHSMLEGLQIWLVVITLEVFFLLILTFMYFFPTRRTPVSFAWWWTPTGGCPSTRRRWSTCTKGRRDTRCPHTSLPSQTAPTGPCFKVTSGLSVFKFSRSNTWFGVASPFRYSSIRHLLVYFRRQVHWLY